MTTQMDEIKQ